MVEDSGKAGVEMAIPQSVREQITVLSNPRPIGQIASIDKAYTEVKTPYLFHCEDDWLFYRPGFIEDSMTILEAEPQAIMVWLRSYHHDLAYYGAHPPRLTERKTTDNITYYPIGDSHHSCFSFNPGLRRHAECPQNGYAALIAKGQSPTDVEIAASEKYSADEYFSVLLENDAVKHAGFGRHVQHFETRWKKYRNRLWRLLVIAAAFALGWWISQ